jgi:hypothetical protein
VVRAARDAPEAGSAGAWRGGFGERDRAADGEGFAQVGFEQPGEVGDVAVGRTCAPWLEIAML